MGRTFLRASLLPLFIVLILAGISGCRANSGVPQRQGVVTAISADFDYLNPLLMQLSLSREICKLIYPTLARPSFDEKNGTIRFLPATAKSWEFSKDGRSATFHLKSGCAWEDGKPVTARDFKYSYALYINPKIASARQHYLDDLLLLSDGTPDINRAVETPNDSTLILRFSKPMAPEIVLDHFNDLMPVAEHLFKAYAPEDIRAKSSEIPVLGAGPFMVKKWARQERLELESSPSSRLPRPATIKSMIFVVVPEYTTRLAMLRSGQIDAMISAGGINPKEVKELEKNAPNIEIKPVRNRYFDSVVWLNIDGEAWRASKKIVPHPLFGDSRVRRALTLAIDRQSIIDGFMGPLHATIVNTSLSPAHRNIIDGALDPYDFNPKKATALLLEAGWAPGADGILRKNGKRFSFELAAPVGNPRRNYAATIIQQNLRDIGIDCRLRFDESLVFLKSQNEYRYDAALSGLAAETLPFQLAIWGSDFIKRPFNSSAFTSKELDAVVGELQRPLPEARKIALWKRYQKILHDEQPRTFLYYYDELEGFSKRITNAEVNLISTLYNAHEWSVR
ncbi:MAG: ABC transporter substrate-binding protein [Chlorobiaceae bacterium]